MVNRTVTDLLSFGSQWVKDELSAFQRLWDALGSIWRSLDEFGEKLFRDLKPTEMRER